MGKINDVQANISMIILIEYITESENIILTQGSIINRAHETYNDNFTDPKAERYVSNTII